MAADRIEIQRGNPYIRTITITDADGNAYDLTDKTIFFTVKNIDDSADNDDDALITKDITEHTNDEGGISSLELTAEQTLAVPVGDYKYDLRIYEDGVTQINSATGVCAVVDITTKRTS